MANEEHVAMLRQGPNAWNRWLEDNRHIKPDFSNANLSGASLRKAYLHNADFSGADLSGAYLTEADLRSADLRGASLHEAKAVRANLSGAKLDGANLRAADLREANLTNAVFRRAKLGGANLKGAEIVNCDFSDASLWSANFIDTNLIRINLTRANLRAAFLRGANFAGANLKNACLKNAHLPAASLIKADISGADLSGADLSGAGLDEAKLSGANLREANLERCSLVGANLEMADLTGCRIYGISAWDLKLKDTSQTNLVITPDEMPAITVDNLEVAQFLYLLLYNPKIREVIDTITSKVVLILGRFTDERKAVLEAIREDLRRRDCIPVLFDFDKPASKDLTGTVEILARMARFIIADITDPSSIPHELATIVPFLRTTPVVPLRLKGSSGYSLFDDLEAAYNWVLPIYEYDDGSSLIKTLPEVMAPAVKKLEELRGK